MKSKRDSLSKRERVLRTLNLQPVDRVAIHDYIHNPRVLSLYSEPADMHRTVRETLDLWRPMGVVSSTGGSVEDGFEFDAPQGWTAWITRYPFDDLPGLKEYILRDTDRIRARATAFDPGKERDERRRQLLGHIESVGDDTVMMEVDHTPLRDCLWRAGIELFSYLIYDDPDAIHEWLNVYLTHQLQIIDAVADRELAPVVLIANEIASSAAPLLSPEFLKTALFPAVGQLIDVWHRHGIKVILEIQGNCRELIPPFIECGADGFYAIEAIAGMDIVELKNRYPRCVWVCGVDGANLMTFGTPEQVEAEVLRQIEGTDALRTGGLFIGSSSEINPPIEPEIFKAMIDAARSVRNDDFAAS